MTSTMLVATWRDGLFVVSGGSRDQELGTQSVRGSPPTVMGAFSVSSMDARSAVAHLMEHGARSRRRRLVVSRVAWRSAT